MPAPTLTITLDTDRLDQHLTISSAVVARLVATAGLQPSDTTLDIGAGTGLITRAIARRGCATIAVELDRRFAHYLQPLHGTDRITVQWADFLTVAPREVTTIVANPPFGATEHLVNWFTRLPRLRHISFIVGSRFARAAIAFPGDADYTRQSLHVQAAFIAGTHGMVERTAFYPIARRDAAIVTLRPMQPSLVIGAFDAAVHRRAGMRLRRLVLDLQRQRLLPTAVDSSLAIFWHKRLQELTNDEISRTALTLSCAES